MVSPLQIFIQGTLCVLTTILFIVSQLSLLLILDQKNSIPILQWAGGMLVVLLLPEVVALWKLLWTTPFLLRNTLTRWPSCQGLVVGITVAILEAGVLSAFLYYVAAVLPGHVLIPIMSATLTARLLFQQKTAASDVTETAASEDSGHRNLCRWRIWDIVLGLVILCCLIGISCMYGISGNVKVWQAVFISVLPVALSILWLPSIQVYTFRSRLGDLKGRNIASLLYGALKIIFLCLFMTLLTSFEKGNATTNRSQQTHVMIFWITVVVHSISGLLCRLMTYISTALCTTRAGLLVPSIICTPVTICVVIYCCMTGNIISQNSIIVCGSTSVITWISFGLAVVIWIIPFLSRPKEQFKAGVIFFRPLNQTFLRQSYNTIFLSQSTYLNYSSTPLIYTNTNIEDQQATTVFICTTMYREAACEMERLLKSLQNISNSKNFTNIYLEAHIFMDNGVEGESVTTYAQQLISLIDEKLDMKLSDASCLQTPYGMQLQWKLHGGLPFYVHLKDSTKVKPKKRWSQVLYMQYIIEHRVRELGGGGRCAELQDQDHSSVNTVMAENSTADKSEISKSECAINNTDCSNDMNIDKRSFGQKPSGRAKWLSADDELKPLLMNSSSRTSRRDRVSCPSSGVVTRRTVLADDSHREHSISFNDFSGIDERTYILSTDADMEFDDESVYDVICLGNQDMRLSGVCGRTHPIGQKINILGLFQMFEYANAFWMKSAQNVLGSVMCCPGCFSLYRVKALAEVVMDYATPATNPTDMFFKDTGEDRWICTLMMMKGWKLKYTYYGKNTTFCPDNVPEFMRQRRRWILSDIANTFLVFRDICTLIRRNKSFSTVYVFTTLLDFIMLLLGPAIVILACPVGLELTFGLAIRYTTPPLSAILLFYTVICWKAPSWLQMWSTRVLMVILGLLVITVTCGIVHYLVMDIKQAIHTGYFEIKMAYFLFPVIARVIYSGLLHFRESWIIIMGLLYLFYFPTICVLLPIYSVCNIVDQSWGTRDTEESGVNYGSRNEMSLDSAQSVDPTQPDVQRELDVWNNIVGSLVGKDVNLGINKEDQNVGLRRLRRAAVIIYVLANIVTIGALTTTYEVVDVNGPGFHVFTIVVAVVFGFPFLLQLIGMTLSRIEDVFHKCVKTLKRRGFQTWTKRWHSHENS